MPFFFEAQRDGHFVPSLALDEPNPKKGKDIIGPAIA